MAADGEIDRPMMVAAFYDDRRNAERAVADLAGAGIANDRIRLVPGYEEDAGDAAARRDMPVVGLADVFGSFLFADEDAALFREGLRRGGYLLTVEANEAEHDRVLGVLDRDGVIDLDERAEQWRASGWTGSPGSASGRVRRYGRG